MQMASCQHVAHAWVRESKWMNRSSTGTLRSLPALARHDRVRTSAKNRPSQGHLACAPNRARIRPCFQRPSQRCYPGGSPPPRPSSFEGRGLAFSNGWDRATALSGTVDEKLQWLGNRAGAGSAGDGDEATVVSFGPSSSNKFITTYFRHAFNVASSSTLPASSCDCSATTVPASTSMARRSSFEIFQRLVTYVHTSARPPSEDRRRTL